MPLFRRKKLRRPTPRQRRALFETLEDRSLLATLDFVDAFGDNAYNSLRDIAVDTSGNSYITGGFRFNIDFDPSPNSAVLSSGPSQDLFVGKYALDGSLLWAKKLGSDEVQSTINGTGVAVDQNGSVWVAGTFAGTIDFDPGPDVRPLTGNGFLLKLSAGGELQWVGTMRGITEITSLVVDGSGQILLGGSYGFGSDFDPGPGEFPLSPASSAFVMKVHSDGTLVWAKALGVADNRGKGEQVNDIAVDHGGNVCATGVFKGAIDLDPGAGSFELVASQNTEAQVFIVKLTAEGNFVWGRGLLGGYGDARGIAVDSAGQVYTVGEFSGAIDFDPGSGVANRISTSAPYFSLDGFVSKLNSDGDFLWAHTFGGEKYDSLYDVALADNDSVLMTGRFNGAVDFDPGPQTFNLTAPDGPFPATDVIIWRLNSAGGFVEAHALGGSGLDDGQKIAFEPVTRGLYVGGSFERTADFDPGAGTISRTSQGGSDFFLMRLQTDAPIAPSTPPSGADRSVSMLEDTTYTFTRADFTFSDPLDVPPSALAAVRIASLPAVGTLLHNGIAVAAGQLVSAASLSAGALRYTPPPHASGDALASFTFQVQDSGGASSGGSDLDPTPNTISFNVIAVNDPPAGADRTVTLAEDTTYVIAPADFEFSDPLDQPANGFAAVRIVALPSRGSLTNNGVAVVAGQVIAVADMAAGSLRFTPEANAAGTPLTSLTFQVQDNGGTAGGGTDFDPTTNTLTFAVSPVNDPPVITSNGGGDTASFNVPESGVSVTITDVDATDADGSANLTYSTAGGADAARFSINPATGLLRLIGSHDFESPSDANGDNVYEVIVRVSDGSLSDTQTIAVTVTNVSEPPTIISNGAGATASISLPENTLIATDVNANGDTGRLVYSVSGGGDAAKFSIHPTTGLLHFLTAPNFERPADAGGDNVYDVVVQVSDGQITDTQTLTIRVTDVNEAPTATADVYSAFEDAPLTIGPATGVLANDTDEDAGDAKMVVAVAAGGVLWDEAAGGDLPSAQPYPLLLLAPGVNEIRGTTGNSSAAPNDLDAFIIEVPEGLQVTSFQYAVARREGSTLR